jgi:hypothetical protein
MFEVDGFPPAIRHLNACKFSGLRTKQHHEVNHFLYSVSSQAYNQVQKEVVVKERSTVQDFFKWPPCRSHHSWSLGTTRSSIS